MNQIATKQNGFALQPQSLTEAMQLAEMLSSSQMVPKNYTGKPQDTLVAMMMGSELGLNPIQALQNIAVINGRPSIYGDALMALVQNHPAFGGVEETFDEQTMTATCTVWRKGGTKHTQTFSQADAVKSNLWGKSGPWTQYPKRMLAWRARGFALRNQFADALAGLITREEAMDIPESKDMGPAVVEPTTYSDQDFQINFPKWEMAILAGKKTATDLVAMVESKAPLSEDQKQQILSIGSKAA